MKDKIPFEIYEVTNRYNKQIVILKAEMDKFEKEKLRFNVILRNLSEAEKEKTEIVEKIEDRIKRLVIQLNELGEKRVIAVKMLSDEEEKLSDVKNQSNEIIENAHKIEREATLKELEVREKEKSNDNEKERLKLENKEIERKKKVLLEVQNIIIKL